MIKGNGSTLGARLSFNQKRLVVSLAALPCLFFLANSYLLDPGFLVPYKRTALVLSFAFLAVVMHFAGPSVEEIREYRASQGTKGPP
jgi:hypothetical protein